ncbi:D-alanyl-D-alanine carboxypeptidase/D-alanyl-D-alanine endopeptidase [Salinibacter ruber]|uniref:D-alanyl-D-alanine carboxypeptidase/D-alanyl-D-alanine endopeptidase n=1 Tax=Salinibacter ruber TaxID=146919 RepID=UPI00216818E1|nr:D-alanyl-D-alanine carboxypeptidase/D-alanyl-D-alanine-endopeptidase [Salinibacter ruber]MCS4197923.1 D-alanyl-D-alanine carboxypeptidase/D-alanyl-D-alanine-endopeptidase (penicillin-binding protein 4) [Salinibacter ruber]
MNTTSMSRFDRQLGGRMGLLAGLLMLVVGAGKTAVAQPATEPQSTRAYIRSVVTDTIEAAPYTGALWGIEVTNLETGERLFQHNPDHLFTPASNAKLLTAAAALRRLGPSYRYNTRLYVDGPVRNGVLRGNLIVRGSGDPTLGGYAQRDDPTAVFRDWADSLRAAGITRIEGDILGDDNPFSDVPLGDGWGWNDVPYAYAAEINGLVFNGNTIDLEVRGRQVGAPGRVTWSPFETDFVRVRNQSRTVPRDSTSDEDYERPFSENTFTVRSRIHPNEVQEETLTITEPTKYFTHTLRSVLLREGISVGGQGRDVDDSPLTPRYEADSVRRVGTYRSPPLREVVQTMNHESQNLYAEQLLRTLAVVGPPDTTADDLTEGSAALGALAVRTELSEVGIDTSRVRVVDGSGLSRKNYVRPRAMTRLLVHMWSEAPSDRRAAFYDSLPTGGREGTLEYRFPRGAAARGEVRAKTGTLTGASALSGYVRTPRGTPLAFVIFCNHHLADAEDVRAAQDAIVNALAERPL